MKPLFYCTLLLMALQLSSQPKHQEIDLGSNSPFLLGEIMQNHLEAAPYNEWFQTNYDKYLVDAYLISKIKKKLKKHQLTLFLGTWCGDSKREVPRILKLLEAADFPKEKLRIVALDKRKENYKKGPNGEEQGWNIKRVPTLVLTRKGNEVNRIVERPVDTLEEDLFAILNHMEYTPNYSD